MDFMLSNVKLDVIKRVNNEHLKSVEAGGLHIRNLEDTAAP